MKLFTIIVPAGILYLLWLALSGHYEPFLMTVGLISSLAVAMLSSRLGILHPAEHGLLFAFRMIRYIPWLLVQVVKSNLDVTRRVWSPTIPLSPTIVKVEASQKTNIGLALHANSITLTPGTLSIDTGPNYIEVHALSKEIADDLSSGEMDKRVNRVEGNS